jgi:hypothetical protein
VISDCGQQGAGRDYVDDDDDNDDDENDNLRDFIREGLRNGDNVLSTWEETLFAQLVE